MFDNLEPTQGVPPGPANPNQPLNTASFPPQAKVDDIFANVKETAVPNSKNGLIPPPLKVTNRSGGLGGVLKILIILIVVLILAIGGLVVASQYFGFTGLSQFFPAQEDVQIPVVEKQVAPVSPVDTDVPVTDKKTGPGAGMPGIAEEKVATSVPPTGMPGDKPATSVSTSTPAVIPAAVSTTTPAVISSTIPAKPADIPATLDSDKDGLIDSQEISLGTNPNKADTDGDGLSDGDEVNVSKTNPLKVDTDNDELSDYDEVKVYLTNPTNPDTDADTFLDGKEVKGGYNPKGPGKLVK